MTGILDLSFTKPSMTVTPSSSYIEQTMNHAQAVQRVRLQVTALPVTVLAANDYGSAALCVLPNTNLLYLGGEVSLAYTKGGVTNGIITTKDVDLALGTVAASSNTLSSTMVDLLPKVTNTTDSLTDTINSAGIAATPVLKGIPKGTTNKVFLNVAIVGGITADDTITFTGTVDLYYIDLKAAS